jgi:hypothetical protein
MEKIYNRLNNHLVFIGIFHFLGGKFEYEQALFHSYLPFPKYLGQVLHFYKSDWANLIETNLKFLETFLSVVAY